MLLFVFFFIFILADIIAESISEFMYTKNIYIIAKSMYTIDKCVEDVV